MNSILSDYNRSGYVPSVTKTIRYSDLDFALRVNSYGDVKGDLIPLTDTDAIKNSIRNLVLCDPYERPFEPNLSSGIRRLLFENANPLTEMSLKEEIERVITRFEPRVSSVKVTVEDYSYNNAYNVTVNFSINNFNPQSIEFIINRLR